MESLSSVTETSDNEETDQIVFAVVEDGDEIYGVDVVHSEEDKGSAETETKQESESSQETVEAKTRFFRTFMQRVFESIGTESPINDVSVTFRNSDHVIRIPALLLASVSPVFKAAGVLTDVETQAVILPDVDINDFRLK
jgi:hypothetical protein